MSSQSVEDVVNTAALLFVEDAQRSNAPEPFVGGHNLANRALDTLFARDDAGKYDAPAPTVRRAKDDLKGSTTSLVVT